MDSTGTRLGEFVTNFHILLISDNNSSKRFRVVEWQALQHLPQSFAKKLFEKFYELASFYEIFRLYEIKLR